MAQTTLHQTQNLSAFNGERQELLGTSGDFLAKPLRKLEISEKIDWHQDPEIAEVEANDASFRNVNNSKN
jgi:hypothetical protein